MATVKILTQTDGCVGFRKILTRWTTQYLQVARGPESGRGAQRSHKLRHKSGGGDLVRGSNYVHALILIGQLRS